MSSKTSRLTLQPPAKPVGHKAGSPASTNGTTGVPAVARRGRLTLQQIRHAVATALRGQTFEADAQR
jgi:hypothetical protein